mmetsp:Transcript_3885/g.7763  ORF Transcript_3885/g.7763 Transcript_3885/m.7763 type:complete len:618 (-) Transcript_3885:1307-3160(-)
MATKKLSWLGMENTERDTAEFRVWLTRLHESEPWQPLRHVDCRALRQQMASQPRPVHIEGGRATADPVANLVFYNFFRGPQRELTSAVWFIQSEKEDKGKKAETDTSFLLPIQNAQDEDRIESLYQNTLLLLEEGTADVASISPQIVLSDQSKVKVVQQGRELTIKRTAAGWFGHQQVLQRGYGPYTVAGEAEEAALGPVRSLIFVIHGIGEAYFTRENLGKLTPSMIEQTNATRIALQKRQVEQYHKQCEVARKAGQPVPPKPFRTELLPVEWFHCLRDEKQSDVMRSLQAVTINSIPALRSIANDIIFDVLVYMTPAFCQQVLECVTEQIATLYAAFSKIHPEFATHGGHTSLMGHSLGSVICWDILALLHDQKQQQSSMVVDDGVSTNNSITTYSTWGPTLQDRTTLMERGLPFEPQSVILLGSPLGMFLSLRGAQTVFEELRSKNNARISPFVLPVQKRFINIFNTSDPVAYRLEPLLLEPGATNVPPPAYLTAPGKDVRLHVKARQLGDTVRKSLLEPTATWSAVLGSMASATVAATEAISKASSNDNSNNAHSSEENAWKFPLGGASDRVDYAFQPALVDNEYISAVLAHSTNGYFMNSDFLDYLVHIVTE